jgi:hypothetical protein
MDHEIDKQEPSGKEGREMKNPKVGDWVWVKGQIKNTQFGATETEVEICEQRVYVRIFDCRPVEPVNSPEIPDSSSDPMREAFEAQMVKRYDPNREYLARNEDTRRYFDDNTEMAWQAFQAGAKYGDSSGGWNPTKDEIEYAMDSCCVPASDPLAVGDAVVIVERSHKWRGVRGRIVSVSESNEFPLEFISDCRKRLGYFRSSSIRKIEKADPVNPSHYKQGAIECIEAIKAATGEGFVGYVWGNVLKYLWRWPKKGGVDDLKKARWYLDRLIKEVGE